MAGEWSVSKIAAGLLGSVPRYLKYIPEISKVPVLWTPSATVWSSFRQVVGGEIPVATFSARTSEWLMSPNARICKAARWEALSVMSKSSMLATLPRYDEALETLHSVLKNTKDHDVS
jgi:hypothetical protein